MAEFINTIDRLGDDAVIDSIIDRTITEFKDDQITKVGNYAFYGCTALTEVDLPNVTTAEEGAFNGCIALTEINLPNVTHVGKSCFAGAGLERLILPSLSSVGNNSMTTDAKYIKLQSLESITAWSFNIPYCIILDLPSAASIAVNSISNPQKMKALVLRNTSAVCSLGATLGSYFGRSELHVYVPRALVDSYKVATNWSAYADKFRALEDYTVDGTVTGELDESKI